MEKNLRVAYMNSEDSLGKRIREGEQQRIPYLVVLGDKEIESGTVTVRSVQTKEQVSVSVDEFLEKTVKDVRERRLKASIG